MVAIDPKASRDSRAPGRAAQHYVATEAASQREETMKCTAIPRIFLLGIIVAGGSILVAQQAKVRISVYPPETQIFVDAKTWGRGPAKEIKTTAGTHMVIVANYGFVSQTREVSLNEGDNPAVEFTLQRSGEPVSGPWGRIQIENAPGQAAVLLNGTTPGYAVGHADMFNHDIIWHQQLVVPAGKHHVTIATRDGVFWSGDVDVQPNTRVIINAGANKITVKNWTGAPSSLPRFTAGIASASVAVAPVTANFAAEPTNINCGDTTRLAWSTKEAVDTTISANSASLGEVPVSGERAEQPKQTTTYQFQTAGPGGVVTSSATTEVNTVVKADLGTSPAEVRYHRMGDKVVEHTPANLNWTSSNADSASIDPIGTVGTKGDQEIKPAPKQSANGPVDENVTYTFTAKNVCGGSETRTANVHVTGMIEPVPEVPLASVFFPTGYPEEKHPQLGLVRSQHDVLAKTAEGMKKYLIYDPEARITLTAHADARDSSARNQSLSERRANRVKTCLVKLDVPENKIDIVAVGENQNLTPADVQKLHDENPNKPGFAKRNSPALVWAYNRRVDIRLLPTKQNSTQFFPGNADEAKLLFRSKWQGRRSVEKAGEGTAGQPSAGEATGTQPITETAAVKGSK
jgi:outer membrane protein OmpA-like peptidoglycan-associated protein